MEAYTYLIRQVDPDADDPKCWEGEFQSFRSLSTDPVEVLRDFLDEERSFCARHTFNTFDGTLWEVVDTNDGEKYVLPVSVELTASFYIVDDTAYYSEGKE